ncbi:transcriptional regulator, MarR family [Staphylothermus hellenicus DSM 12710]|uniref:Transcriptional regulator, MarR family n=1 Tax=Staphylothermus hellenicus (strain DSM 12710 / JCM 10830 / BK20S6-10-b1 / P8) TaxID=591019 RepID=D7D910_STAHD|nr:transcriptional regulator, MarR family [Staphylothermus hellenicus DSM 12710]
MSKQIFTSKGSDNIRSLKYMIKNNILIINDLDGLMKLGDILSSKTRLLILYSLSRNNGLSIKELSKITGLPISVISKHVKKLEEAGLVISGLKNGNRGLRKIVIRRISKIMVNL